MKIFVGLVAADEHLRRQFGLAKDAVIPRDALSRGYFGRIGANVLHSAFVPDGVPSEDELEKFVLSRAKDADACILLVDADLVGIARNIRNSVFIVTFENGAVGSSTQNFFHYTISRALKYFGQILSRFDKADDGELLTLPLRNFHSKELATIAQLCREANMHVAFGDLIEQQLVKLRLRIRPRRRTNYKTVYAVDDMNRFFIYGKERHARIETGGGHKTYCGIAGYLRFGKKIDAERHFNVSETEGDKTSISGVFIDCHDTEQEVKQHPITTHLNMFANDYF